ncbi:peptidase S8/S53 domain-containing protein [Cantharellus anzutake]|uniref:peptidase S8/S53 domain-containing protein n=1 Tax=Cantharellus anzutake TaxID=1750568 RepID=UPI001906AD23|nr:peptidase S8/S53 domain-containing protein [Cantharellus anzutake]KAF8316523.1 peptidase S8/S53 domain-containing protein [Cantharellus anzutake]
MKFSTAAIIVITLTTTTLALAASIPIRMPKGPVKPDSYIIKLKSGANLEDHIESITRISTQNPGSKFLVTYRYQILNGYSVYATGTPLSCILICSEVDYVEADVTTSSDNDVHHVNERDVAESDDIAVEMEDEDDPVGLKARVTGQEVMVFIIATGVFTSHNSLSGDEIDEFGQLVPRVAPGPGFGYRYSTLGDEDGLGTFLAGLAIGIGYSVAPTAMAISLKVCKSHLNVRSINILKAIEYAYKQFQKTPELLTIVLITANLRYSQAINDAITLATNHGLYVVVAAGDGRMDASFSSPASAPGAITVGAVDCFHNFLSISNYGPLVDVFADGFNAQSAWIGRVDAINSLTGTGPAAARVASILADALHRAENKQLTPAQILRKMQDNAAPVVKGQPEGTRNYLAQVGW